MTADKKLYRQALDDVRDDYRAEIEQTVKKLIDIRDDPDTPARDVINAAKTLAVMLGVPRPAEQRVTAQEKPKGPDPESWDLSPEERERVESILREN